MIIERISKETGVSVASVEAIINAADRLYRTYDIRKRTGGVRQINHPTPVLKFLQRWVVRNIFVHLPVHPGVMSYRRGIGIDKNADLHVSKKYLMKLDFRDFFPSIKSDDIRALIRENMAVLEIVGLSDGDVDLVAKIVCRNGRLTIGAPCSPSISNAILFKFDCRLTEESHSRGVQYSRYADDIVFSTDVPNVLREVYDIIGGVLIEQPSPQLVINTEKTVFTSKKRRRIVTGLFLTSENKVSIGRDKKREVKTLCYKFRLGHLSAERASYLRGYLAYVRSVEPDFISSLQKKFGDDVMMNIMRAPLIGRK